MPSFITSEEIRRERAAAFPCVCVRRAAMRAARVGAQEAYPGHTGVARVRRQGRRREATPAAQAHADYDRTSAAAAAAAASPPNPSTPRRARLQLKGSTRAGRRARGGSVA